MIVHDALQSFAKHDTRTKASVTVLTQVQYRINSAVVTVTAVCILEIANAYVCVCVFFPSILDIKFVGRTSRGHTGGRLHRIFLFFLIHLPSAVRALIFVARRIQPFLSLVDREVEFCVLTN